MDGFFIYLKPIFYPMQKLSFAEFANMLENVFDGLDKGSLKQETKFRDLAEWTSINAMILVALYETEFDKQVGFDKLRSCETVQDLYSLA